jgi:hypothetical protein
MASSSLRVRNAATEASNLQQRVLETEQDNAALVRQYGKVRFS